MKKRKHNKSNYFFDLPFDLILHIFSFLNRLRALKGERTS